MYNFASILLNDKLHENTYNILVGVGPKNANKAKLESDYFFIFPFCF